MFPKPEFLSALSLKKDGLRDNGKWKLDVALLFRSRAAGRIIAVPRGFRTDLASVPRLPIIFWLCGGTSDEAAVVHDWLYTSKIVDRRTADAVLLEASRVTGVPAWRRYLMWAAVRVFGGSHWSNRKPSLTLV